MQVHESIPSILNALFANFKADYVENVDELFASALSRKNVVEFLGLNDHSYYRNYCYILVLYRKNIGARKLFDDGVDSRLQLSAKVLNAIQNITVGDVPSALNFVSNYGSHFVRSYSIGEAIYQVSKNHNFLFPFIS